MAGILKGTQRIFIDLHSRDVYKRQVSTPGILIARSFLKPDETGTVPIKVANILDQAITLQSNTLLGKLTPVA